MTASASFSTSVAEKAIAGRTEHRQAQPGEPLDAVAEQHANDAESDHEHRHWSLGVCEPLVIVGAEQGHHLLGATLGGEEGRLDCSGIGLMQCGYSALVDQLGTSAEERSPHPLGITTLGFSGGQRDVRHEETGQRNLVAARLGELSSMLGQEFVDLGDDADAPLKDRQCHVRARCLGGGDHEQPHSGGQRTADQREPDHGRSGTSPATLCPVQDRPGRRRQPAVRT